MTVPFWYWAGLIICVCLAAFFSAAEMAISSANTVRLENLAENGSRRARAASKLIERYDDVLSAILIGNNLANNATSTLTAVIAMGIAATFSFSEDVCTVVGTVVITLVVIVFSESMPKIVAKKNANRYSMAFAYVLRALTLILAPLVFLVVKLVHLITKPGSGGDSADEQDDAVEELQAILETVEDEGVINEERSELLQAALDFKEISASEVMTARVDMVALDIDDSWEDALELIESAPFSRLPVYRDSRDNIIGILYLNRFFKALIDEERPDIASLLMEPCYVYKTVKLPAVLQELRKRRVHIAIVTDEYGGSMGIVTMEDVLEQIVGDIWDEYDEIEDEIVEKADGLYELDGDMSTGDFLELMGWDEDSFDFESDTVGGWTTEMFGRFPAVGDSFDYENLTVTVQAMDGLRVDSVLVRVNTPEEK